MKKLIVLLGLVTVLAVNPPTYAEITGSVSVGDAKCLAVKNKTVYCGLNTTENNLRVIDASDRTNPTIATTRTVGDGPIYDMAITPDHRYLVMIFLGDQQKKRPYSMEKWCIDEPLTPTLIQRVTEVSRIGTFSVCVDDTGTTAFITSKAYPRVSEEDDTFDLRPINLNIETTDSVFNKIGARASNGGFVFDSQSAGDYIYLAAEQGIDNNNFQIRDRKNLALIGGLDIGTTGAYCLANDTTVGITAIGTYGGGISDDILVVDTFKPTNPILIGGVNLGTRISFMRLDWPNLYCFGRQGWYTEYDNTVRLVSLANPSNPTVIEEINIGANIKAVEVTNEAGISTAYVATGSEVITQNIKISSTGTNSNDGSLVILRPTPKASVNRWEMYY